MFSYQFLAFNVLFISPNTLNVPNKTIWKHWKRKTGARIRSQYCWGVCFRTFRIGESFLWPFWFDAQRPLPLKSNEDTSGYDRMRTLPGTVKRVPSGRRETPQGTVENTRYKVPFGLTKEGLFLIDETRTLADWVITDPSELRPSGMVKVRPFFQTVVSGLWTRKQGRVFLLFLYPSRSLIYSLTCNFHILWGFWKHLVYSSKFFSPS